jgi:hypothetical protein
LPHTEIPKQLGDDGAPVVPPKGKCIPRGLRCMSHGQIFHTGYDLEAGQEEKFPGPDNTSKMRRSVENAEHVGKSQNLLHLIRRLRSLA